MKSALTSFALTLLLGVSSISHAGEYVTRGADGLSNIQLKGGNDEKLGAFGDFVGGIFTDVGGNVTALHIVFENDSFTTVEGLSLDSEQSRFAFSTASVSGTGKNVVLEGVLTFNGIAHKANAELISAPEPDADGIKSSFKIQLSKEFKVHKYPGAWLHLDLNGARRGV